MPTPIFLTGFEHGIIATGATPSPNDRIWRTVTGTPTISTTTVRSGARSLRCNTAGTSVWVGRSLTSTNTIILSFLVRFATLPGADVTICSFVSAAGNPVLDFNQATGKLRVDTTTDVGPVLSTGVWYRVDLRYVMSANPWVLKAQVDGGAETTVNQAVAASTMTAWRLGLGTEADTSTADAFFDDLVVSVTSADYPLGDHEVLKMSPNADGTHSFTANDFIRGDAGAAILTSDTDVWTLVDDVPFAAIGTTDSVQQNVIRSTGYVELALEAAPRTVDAWGIQIHTQHDADATGADNVKYQENDGGTTRQVYSGDVSNTTATFLSHCMATAPTGGAYTQAKLDALRLRWGFSSDVTGSPIVHALMLEVAYAVAAAPPPSWDSSFGHTSMALTGVGH